MLRPAMSQILREGESYYALVVAIAARAREISDEYTDKGLSQDVKPVTLSLQEFAAGKVHLQDFVKVKDAN